MGSGNGSLGGEGSVVVGPAPSIGEGGGFGGGQGGGRGLGSGSGIGAGLGGGGSVAVPPAPMVAGATGRPDGKLMAMYTQPAVVKPPPPIADATRASAMVDLPLRLVGIAFALPGTSFFSSYEVFIAERQLSAKASELVKLVYEFLPYQRRLSEYHLDYSKVYKLRVKRDPSCDESLPNIAGVQPTQKLAAGKEGDSFGSVVQGQNKPLPCYRTTADDYRKAMR
jgi:hypothetical protein